ncbi:hypothetical protein Daura_30595 [Dactylosporangium aurantiacum]|uniref:Uncharacterized protein n=1 Tax=Dactylosporangium aurantiacum TaxID=35754 RepID=A0A9Q9IEL8_9ACTN|nr:hypothetical protein [Dactylosporangium aurantiacum]MDG6108746.1 hypothetical protein [Dactylosporangium aurantiacum]UWZ51105.1 hypothetical protein Daura_30595 [Dactylosporangium aurantiacum]
MLFDPAASLLAAQPHGGDVRVVTGEHLVGQLCRDPATFADATTLVAPHAPGAPPLDARARALLSLVWPTSPAQARLIWGARLRPLLGTATGEDLLDRLDDLVPSLVAEVVGIPAPVLRRVEARSAFTARACPDQVTRAAAPLALLHTAVAKVVRDRAARSAAPLRPDHQETVLDEALFWRSVGRDEVSLDEVAALVSALTAAAWDATRAVLPRLLGAMTAPTADGATVPTATAASHVTVPTATGPAAATAATAPPAVPTASGAAVPTATGPAAVPTAPTTNGGPAPTASGVAAPAGSARATADRPAWAGLASGAAERAALVDAAIRGGSPTVGWLRVTTAAATIDGATVPAGTRCLWLVDAADPADRRTGAALRTLRWLSPGAPDGAGATFARLVGDTVLTATAATRPRRPRPYLPDTATA